MSNENNLVICFKNNGFIKKFDDIINHQSKIKKLQAFAFFKIFIQPNDIFQTKHYAFYVFVASVKLSDQKVLWDNTRKHHDLNKTVT